MASLKTESQQLKKTNGRKKGSATQPVSNNYARSSMKFAAFKRSRDNFGSQRRGDLSNSKKAKGDGTESF